MTNPLHTDRDRRSFKQHAVALAICVGLGLGVAQVSSAKTVHAPLKRNVNPPALRAGAPHVYVVKKGDTLWGIAGRFLKSPWRWKEIWASNKHVKNPHWIYPNDRLLLCSHNGRPLIGKDEGDGCEGIIRRAGGQKASPQVRVESMNNMVPIIPLESIRAWLDNNIILAPETVPNVPYIVGATEDHHVASAGDRVYVRGNGLVAGQRYDVYRQGEPFTVPAEKGKVKVVAIEFKKVASGVATQTGQTDNISTLELTDTFTQEVRKGDLVLPVYELDLPTLFYPVPAKEVREGGEVVRVADSISSTGQGGVIVINRGSTDGVQLGHVFALDLPGAMTTDPKTKEKIRLPNQRAGHAMVFKTFENFSYAYVLDSSLPIHVNAKLAVPLSEE